MILKNVLRYIGFLSIDVVLGALAGGIMAVKLLNTQMSVYWWIVLALSVWIIYTADHLIDSLKIQSKAFAKRRQFYHKYFKKLLGAIIILSTAVIYLSLNFLSQKIIFYGMFLGAIIFLYFLFLYFSPTEKIRFLPKELIVAIIYTAGIYFAPLTQTSIPINLLNGLLIFIFFLVVWSDILLIAVFEYEKDLHDGFISFPILFGEKKTTVLIKSILLLVCILLIYSVFYFDKIRLSAAAILFLISVFQLIIYTKRKYFIKNERYRIFTEIIFFLPALMYFT